MENGLKTRDQIEDKYKWDLSSLFVDEDAFETAVASIDQSIGELAAYRGRLNEASVIKEFLDKDCALQRRLENIYTYAMLKRSEDTSNSEAQARMGKAMNKYIAYSSTLAFFRPELLSLDKEKLESFLKDDSLKDYAFLLKKLFSLKDHTLSDKEEELLAHFSDVLNSSSQISSNLMNADMVFDSVEDKDGKLQELNGLNYIFLESSGDRTLRKNAFTSFYKTYRQHNNTLAATYDANVKNAITEAKIRGYGSSREMMMSRSDIPYGVYDRLLDSVHRHLPDMYRYVSLRKKIFGVDELHFYDIYAPLVAGDDSHYSYEQAQEVILDALAVLGEDYTGTVRNAFKEGWIDVFPNKGKRGGAFSSGTYDSKPYILTNFTGTLDAVSTIAHEMGHSMHSYLSKNAQPFHYADYTLFVAEVASTVNENLLIEHLLKNETDPKIRLSLLNQYLENFKGTVFRQTMFAEFEKEAHELAEKGQTLTPDLLNDLYERLVKTYFGDDMFYDDEIKYEWSRIPHFYRPFYVYVYATGYASAVAISEKILKEGKPAVKDYLEFLSMGSSAYPLDELRHAGVDLDTSTPIDMALDKFARVLDEAEKLAKEVY